VFVVERFAQVGDVRLALGDLTVLVGPQATGKSLVLQLLKLALDGPAIARTMGRYGLLFRDERHLLSRYLGEGMEHAWGPKTRVTWNGRGISPAALLRPRGRARHSLYYVPAHRTLVLSDGYPPAFQQFRPETPFVVRHFSEEVRRLLIEGLDEALLFPQPSRLKGKVREKIDAAVFHGAELRDDTSGVQRQLKLKHPGGPDLAYMTWTAGQREFIPLLLGLYYLLPVGHSRRRTGTDWVVIEEPEMGLHPQAIMAFMLLVLDLLARGYRVILSTHSPLVLDVVWALREIRAHDPAWQRVLSLFDLEGVTKAAAPGEARMAALVLGKTLNVHFLDFQGREVRSLDISSLDPGAQDPAIAGWGGLTAFSGRIGQVVASAVNEAR
jgi:hypothetical protein